MNRAPRVVTLGHAIVDVLASCDDRLLETLGLAKATMSLVDPGRANEIQASIVVSAMSSGGSAANTAVSLAALGVPTRFVGRVADDELGRFFASDISAAGVRFGGAGAGGAGAGGAGAGGAGTWVAGAGAAGGGGAPTGSGSGTGSSIVLVSQDAERTMCTSLGVGGELSASDVDASEIAEADFVYVEGYLCGKPETEGAVKAAFEAAAKASTPIALSASDSFWVQLHRDAIRGLLDSVQLLFANEAEALELAGESDMESALKSLSDKCQTVVVTLGAAGCIVVSGGERLLVPAQNVTHVVDTTGAGDSFAAGYLYGIVNNLGARRSAELGNRLAAEVITHLGARPLSAESVRID